MIIELFFFIFGAIIGSFLNVCIIRLAEEKSVVMPPSHCMKCKKNIAWYDNIPLISYWVLGGKCRHCKAKFSMRYFWVELLTGVTFVLFYLYFGLDILLLPYLVMVSGYIIAIFVDFEHRIIPDEVSVGGIYAGLIFSAFIPQMQNVSFANNTVLMTHLKALGFSALGVIIGGGSILLMGLLGDWLFKKEAMGGGDIKLLAMMGAFLGWEKALLAFFIAPFFGAVYGLIEKIRTNDTAIAYGPFLILGALIAQFKGDEIIYWIIHNPSVF